MIVLDPHTEAGVCLPVGLIDFGEPGTAEKALPAVDVLEPLTHLWVLPMAADWLGLRWARGIGSQSSPAYLPSKVVTIPLAPAPPARLTWPSRNEPADRCS